MWCACTNTITQTARGKFHKCIGNWEDKAFSNAVNFPSFEQLECNASFNGSSGWCWRRGHLVNVSPLCGADLKQKSGYHSSEANLIHALVPWFPRADFFFLISLLSFLKQYWFRPKISVVFENFTQIKKSYKITHVLI